MDQFDRRIVSALASHARMSLKELAAVAGLSSPSVAERLKRLEERGIVAGYTIVAPHRMLGYAFQAIVRIDPLPGAVRQVEQLIQETPEIVECDRVTGDDCFYARLYCRSIEDLDPILAPFHDRARTNTALVKGQTVKRRLPPLLDVS